MRRGIQYWMRCLFCLILNIVPPYAVAQWAHQNSNTTERLRAISPVNHLVAWASGNHGTFTRTTDGGKIWLSSKVPGADSIDFRDVEAFSDIIAYLLSIGTGQSSRIYKTTDAGVSWTQQYVGNDPRIFLDEFAFWDSNNGIAVGDEMDGHLYLIKTSDGGEHWARISPENIPNAIPGEGAFAASGSGITVQGTNNVWIGTGVKTARVFRSTDRGESWKVASAPVLHENESTGIFSLAFYNAKEGIAVGGDYRKEHDVRDNAALTTDGGMTWSLVTQSPPSGFRSAVVYSSVRSLIAVGPSGSDSSTDGGKTWHPMGSVGFHAVSSSPDKKDIWAVGENGRIAKYMISRSH